MFGSINKIESMGLQDGPGIRTVIFFNGCKLRCKFCHNPETWALDKNNISVDELMEKIKRFKNYYGSDGGVTLSGGEALLQIDFVIELCKRLKEENINIALDTAGVGIGRYEEVLDLVDLVILDIKDTDSKRYSWLTNHKIDEALEFICALNKCNKKVWIRQVIIPGYNDNLEYIKKLASFIKEIKNIEKIELLPFHNMANSKYQELGIDNPFKDIENMDKLECKKLEEILQDMLKED